MNREESKSWIKKTCGDGWLPLIDAVYDKLPSGIQVTSVYQKWGSLNFDIKPWNENFGGYLEEIKEKSLELCEVCGAKAEEKTTNGWVNTLCEIHYALRLKNT